MPNYTSLTNTHTHHHEIFIYDEDFCISDKLKMSAPGMTLAPLTDLTNSPAEPLAQLTFHISFVLYYINMQKLLITQPPAAAMALHGKLPTNRVGHWLQQKLTTSPH